MPTSPERARDLRLRRQYGITSDDYDAILKYQGGTCWICNRKPAEGKHLNVDHDHKTGLVRGLLCWSCNRRVIANHRGDEGAFLLRTAAMYLESPPAVSAVGEKYGRTGRVTKRRKRKTSK